MVPAHEYQYKIRKLSHFFKSYWDDKNGLVGGNVVSVHIKEMLSINKPMLLHIYDVIKNIPFRYNPFVIKIRPEEEPEQAFISFKKKINERLALKLLAQALIHCEDLPQNIQAYALDLLADRTIPNIRMACVMTKFFIEHDMNLGPCQKYSELCTEECIISTIEYWYKLAINGGLQLWEMLLYRQLTIEQYFSTAKYFKLSGCNSPRLA